MRPNMKSLPHFLTANKLYQDELPWFSHFIAHAKMFSKIPTARHAAHMAMTAKRESPITWNLFFYLGAVFDTPLITIPAFVPPYLLLL